MEFLWTLVDRQLKRLKSLYAVGFHVIVKQLGQGEETARLLAALGTAV